MPEFTSDGLAVYAPAIARVFGAGVNYATTIKRWDRSTRRAPDGARDPSELLVRRVVFGAPDLRRATTAHNERLNLTVRHVNGRMRRRCLAHSKRLANHRASIALTYCWYNLVHVVSSINTTPAVAAGIVGHAWTLDEFMQAVLAAPPCALPPPTPIATRWQQLELLDLIDLIDGTVRVATLGL